MKYTFMNKEGRPQQINIPEEYIARTRKSLNCSNKEAIELYLSDEGYIDNSTVQELTEKAKGQGHRESSGKKRTVTRKPDLFKRAMIQNLYEYISSLPDVRDCEVMNVERIVRFAAGDEEYEVTLSKKRKPK